MIFRQRKFGGQGGLPPPSGQGMLCARSRRPEMPDHEEWKEQAMRKVLQKLGNRYCRWRLERALPGIGQELQAYAKGSATTGTQPITMWLAVRTILRHKPRRILESGTGSSTLILAAAVKRLRAADPGYDGRIISMESVAEWFDTAQASLPDQCRDVVDIILGPREKFEMAMFRGYVHGNIPAEDYDFVLLDGPKFWDERGLAFCADVFRAMELSKAPVIRGVSDGRASSVMVIQAIYGVAAARYWHFRYAAAFALKKIDFCDASLATPKDFRCSPFGRLSWVHFRR